MRQAVRKQGSEAAAGQGVRDKNMGESAARDRAFPCRQFPLGSAMAKAVWGKAVETASCPTRSLLNRP